jgi:hypothetical protein
MAAFTGNQLLSVWEQGRRRHPLDRALLLYAAALDAEALDAPAKELADQPLGRRNLALLRLQASWLGDSMNAAVDCPSCGERLEFSLSARALLANPGRDVDSVEVERVRVRLPTTRDLSSIVREANADAAARKLCLSLVDATQLGETDVLALAPRIEAALDEADPCADVALELACPACPGTWTSSFDIPGYLWEEVEARSRQLLDEVHVLANAYSWAEHAILAMSEARRAAYLERVLG